MEGYEPAHAPPPPIMQGLGEPHDAAVADRQVIASPPPLHTDQERLLRQRQAAAEDIRIIRHGRAGAVAGAPPTHDAIHFCGDFFSIVIVVITGIIVIVMFILGLALQWASCTAFIQFDNYGQNGGLSMPPAGADDWTFSLLVAVKGSGSEVVSLSEMCETMVGPGAAAFALILIALILVIVAVVLLVMYSIKKCRRTSNVMRQLREVQLYNLLINHPPVSQSYIYVGRFLLTVALILSVVGWTVWLLFYMFVRCQEQGGDKPDDLCNYSGGFVCTVIGWVALCMLWIMLFFSEFWIACTNRIESRPVVY